MKGVIHLNYIQDTLEKQREFFHSNETKRIQNRKDCLEKLALTIIKYEDQLLDALKKDLNKSAFEAYETEIGIVLQEINYMQRHLSKWSKRKRVPTPIVHFPSKSYLYKEPYGIALIIAPWNYPFQLVMAPLIGAIAAGNCCMIKPSEYAPYTAIIVERIIQEAIPCQWVTVIQGGVEETKLLLKEKFDYIFFTGGTTVGRIVMEAASKHLTPVTLELGGKSPCIVDHTSDLRVCAKRIVWGKYLNAGQTCVAPDYILVHSSIKDQLIREIRKAITQFYGEAPLKCEDYPKIINEAHFKRLTQLIKGNEIVIGGQYDEGTQKIAPTVVDNITWQDHIMKEEIFGPILPVLTFDTVKEVINQIRENPKPLALYLFTKDNNAEQEVINALSFGGGCINDTIIHLANPKIGFGGVGESGMGQYHGKASFDTFTHEKGIVKKAYCLDVPFRYPPFKNKLPLLKKFMK